jgi:hypothetical protein
MGKKYLYLLRLLGVFERASGKTVENSRYFRVQREFSRGDGFDEDWVVSQPQRSLSGDFLHFAKSRHFPGLAVRSLVSGEEFRGSLAESLESRGRSLLAEFSISEIFVQERPETGCASTETSSNPP